MKGQEQITHHPDRGRLKNYADSLCDRTESLLIEAHLHFCQSCRASVARWQSHLGQELTVNGEISDKANETLLDQQLSCLFQKIDRQEDRTASVSEYGIPAPLLQDLPSASGLRWLSFWPSKGKVAWLASDISGEYDLYLGIIDGDSPTPGHDHCHHEQTLPLLGLYHSMGQTFKPGEWSEMTPGQIHEPSAVAGVRCVCLIRSHRKGFRFVGRSKWRNILLFLAHAGLDLARIVKNPPAPVTLWRK